ncbi:hypothetical protein [Psychroserpens ponticola]|uniref:STAS/SEC14 domain-containing protein n=1 Tax=Psychroserpens ponticola TaxID=2932268 RepID=A0ABY7S2F4_9FLAO|nr:hypothetical protein [Psychroserpens ponticola]WCO03349.1 hypothetical protein MUN68_007555 [Psychroserpens ponticola]
MSIIDSPYHDQLIHQETVALGELYFFKHFFIAEFNEGINITFENFDSVRILIETHFGDSEFGFIANRKNSYSIVITDAPQFNSTFKNLKAYATVTYTSFASKIFVMENHFFKFNRRNFNNLDDAIHWIKDNMKKTNEEV